MADTGLAGRAGSNGLPTNGDAPAGAERLAGPAVGAHLRNTVAQLRRVVEHEHSQAGRPAARRPHRLRVSWRPAG